MVRKRSVPFGKITIAKALGLSHLVLLERGHCIRIEARLCESQKFSGSYIIYILCFLRDVSSVRYISRFNCIASFSFHVQFHYEYRFLYRSTCNEALLGVLAIRF